MENEPKEDPLKTAGSSDQKPNESKEEHQPDDATTEKDSEEVKRKKIETNKANPDRPTDQPTTSSEGKKEEKGDAPNEERSHQEQEKKMEGTEQTTAENKKADFNAKEENNPEKTEEEKKDVTVEETQLSAEEEEKKVAKLEEKQQDDGGKKNTDAPTENTKEESKSEDKKREEEQNSEGGKEKDSDAAEENPTDEKPQKTEGTEKKQSEEKKEKEEQQPTGKKSEKKPAAAKKKKKLPPSVREILIAEINPKTGEQHLVHPKIFKQREKDEHRAMGMLDRMDVSEQRSMMVLESKSRFEVAHEEEVHYHRKLRDFVIRSKLVAVEAEKQRRAREGPPPRQHDQSLDLLYEKLSKRTEDEEAKKIHADRQHRVTELLRLKRASEKLQNELDAQRDYTNAVVTYSEHVEKTRAEEFHQSTVERHRMFDEMASTEVDNLTQQFEESRIERLQKVHEEVTFVKTHGNFPMKLEQAKKNKERVQELTKESDHLRRGWVQQAEGRKSSKKPPAQQQAQGSQSSSVQRRKSIVNPQAESEEAADKNEERGGEKSEEVKKEQPAAEQSVAETANQTTVVEGEQNSVNDENNNVAEAQKEKQPEATQPQMKPTGEEGGPEVEEEKETGKTQPPVDETLKEKGGEKEKEDDGAMLPESEKRRKQRVEIAKEKELLETKLFLEAEEKREKALRALMEKKEARKQEERKAREEAKERTEKAKRKREQERQEREEEMMLLNYSETILADEIRAAGKQRRALEKHERKQKVEQFQRNIEQKKKSTGMLKEELFGRKNEVEVLRETHQRAKVGQDKLDREELEQKKQYYLQRHVADHAKQKNLEAMREDLLSDTSRKWQERYQAESERQEVARLQQMMSVRNRVMQAKADDLMAMDVIKRMKVLNKMENQLKVEKIQQEKMENVNVKKKTLEKMYSGARGIIAARKSSYSKMSPDHPPEGEIVLPFLKILVNVQFQSRKDVDDEKKEKETEEHATKKQPVGEAPKGEGEKVKNDTTVQEGNPPPAQQKESDEEVSKQTENDIAVPWLTQLLHQHETQEKVAEGEHNKDDQNGKEVVEKSDNKSATLDFFKLLLQCAASDAPSVEHVPENEKKMKEEDNNDKNTKNSTSTYMTTTSDNNVKNPKEQNTKTTKKKNISSDPSSKKPTNNRRQETYLSLLLQQTAAAKANVKTSSSGGVKDHHPKSEVYVSKFSPSRSQNDSKSTTPTDSQPTRVLAPEFLELHPTLSNPTRSMIAKAQCSDKLKDMATRLMDLMDEVEGPAMLTAEQFAESYRRMKKQQEDDENNANDHTALRRRFIEESPNHQPEELHKTNASTTPSYQERKVFRASDRLTKRTISQDALALFREQISIPPTIHDGKPPVREVNKRLYNAELYSRRPATTSPNRSHSGSNKRKNGGNEEKHNNNNHLVTSSASSTKKPSEQEVDQYFTDRFYYQPKINHRKAEEATLKRTLKDSVVIGGDGHALRTLGPEDHDNLMARLTKVRTKNDATKAKQVADAVSKATSESDAKKGKKSDETKTKINTAAGNKKSGEGVSKKSSSRSPSPSSHHRRTTSPSRPVSQQEKINHWYGDGMKEHREEMRKLDEKYLAKGKLEFIIVKEKFETSEEMESAVERLYKGEAE